jgi:hypothetical protein
MTPLINNNLPILIPGFSNNCRSFVSNHFLNVKINFRAHFPHFAITPKDFYACLTNCVRVFSETFIKKGAGRPIVRTEQIVTK